MTELMRRRRALMGKREKESDVIFSLESPVTHSTQTKYESNVDVWSYDAEWSIFADFNISNRDFDLYNLITVSSNNPGLDARDTGGFCVKKGNIGGIYGTHFATKGADNTFGSSFPWTKIGMVRMCIVHEKGNKQFTCYLTYDGQTYGKIAHSYTVYPTQAGYYLSAIFTGTMSALTVFAKAKTEQECESFLLS